MKYQRKEVRICGFFELLSELKMEKRYTLRIMEKRLSVSGLEMVPDRKALHINK